MPRRAPVAALTLLAFAAPSLAHEPQADHAAPSPGAPADEARSIRNLVRLTSPAQFHKAGEAYFDPYARWIVFQAVPAPAEGQAPDPHYSIYVARLRRDASKRVVGLDAPLRISPPGSANTCAYFFPRSSHKVMFASTIQAPASNEGAGFQRDRSDYKWSFPPEMEICSRTVPEVMNDILGPEAGKGSTLGPDASAPVPIFVEPGYDAECHPGADARHIVYTHADPATGDPDIWAYNLGTRERIPLVVAPGYDGGPFFSPDGRTICYRSDRKADGRLQLFVASLRYSEQTPAHSVPGLDPSIQVKDPVDLLGVIKETQVTDNEHVNWAPFWSSDGAFLVYTTSELGHQNYEIFSIEAPVGANAGKRPAELKKRRITFSPGFDGLPAFSGDGRLLMWTSQRPADAAGAPLPPDHMGAGVRSSTQVWLAEVVDARP